jgi:glycosyltransferase involved in cell wall biosynthesis
MAALGGERPLPVTVIVLTFNEARNLGACLDSVTGWATGVCVVDSGSSDETQAIARGRGALVVEHAFETHARQWQWALASLPLVTSWILAIDADQRVTPELRAELRRVFAEGPPAETSGFFVNRRQIFRGRWIRHGGYHPKYLLKVFRRDAVMIDAGELVDHHFTVNGFTEKLPGDLVEDNLNEAAIAVWTEKHNRYAVLQARQEVLEARGSARVPMRAVLGPPDARVRWLKQVWSRLPLLLRPCLYVFYRYVIRAGFLDGREGFVFHVLQGFWYRLLVDVNIEEERASTRARVSPADGRTMAKPEGRD